MWVARLAAPLAFFFAATVLVILVQRALDDDSGGAQTSATATEPAATEPATTTSPDGTTVPQSEVPRSCRKLRYRVRPGDTLESIAAKCHVPLDELLTLNPDIDPLTLNPGDKIRIRTSGET